MVMPRNETILQWLEKDLSQSSPSESDDEDDEDDGDLEEHHIPLSSPHVSDSGQEACDLERDDNSEEDNIPLSQLAGYQSRSGTKWSKFPPPTSRNKAHTLCHDSQVPNVMP
ncbi:hypothetical protein HHI36_023343 [Cryptolaemus montrouzieri]|uniref:Uncharacterized protein n=1 Tax=Cryptolaemus montrouzieri TaxID=559131 RepID=A0ABD2PGW4_9CUCU